MTVIKENNQRRAPRHKKNAVPLIQTLIGEKKTKVNEKCKLVCNINKTLFKKKHTIKDYSIQA